MRMVACEADSDLGSLHDLVTWCKITNASEQVAQWEYQNKGRSRWTGTSCIVYKVPVCNSVVYQRV